LGLISGSCIIDLKFNDILLDKPLSIQKNDIVIAGETILAELKE
jgi:hypothetical protein